MKIADNLIAMALDLALLPLTATAPASAHATVMPLAKHAKAGNKGRLTVPDSMKPSRRPTGHHGSTFAIIQPGYLFEVVPAPEMPRKLPWPPV